MEWLGLDMHAHLLPGIDDGAADIEQSVAFVRELGQLGFSKLICTPHIFTELYPNTSETIGTALRQVKTALNNEQVNVTVEAAAEYMVDDTFQVCKGLLCMPGRHVLIEMSYISETPNIEQVVFELQLIGFKVILAHPERYLFYHKNADRYRRLKDMGLLFQVNLLSLGGYYGREVKQAAEHLMNKKSYDFAGTDLHHGRHMAALKNFVLSGNLYNAAGNYPFKNKSLL